MMLCLAQQLPEGMPETIEEYQWFLKELNTPQWQCAFRVMAVLVVLFVLITYLYYAHKDRQEQDEEN